MINLLLLLALLACLGISSAWIAENPGNVTMYWFDYRIDTSIAFMLLLLVLAAIVLTFCYNVLRQVFLLPARRKREKHLRNASRAITELTYSVAALAASDTQGALLHTKKVEKLLGVTPLTLLLGAQIARNQGDDAKTQKLLEQLLEHKETEYLAARSLSDVAGKSQHSMQRALELAERAYALNSRDKASTTALVSLHVKLGQWPQALRVVNQSKSLTRAEKRHVRGIVLLAHAKALAADGREETALLHAKAALANLPGFAPAICFTARQYLACGEGKKAAELLIKSYKQHPHNQVGDLLSTISVGQPPAMRKKIEAMLNAHLPENSVQWRCATCDATQHTWQPHCSACGMFDSLAA